MSRINGWDWFEPQGDEMTEDGRDHWQSCFASDAGQKVIRELERQILQTALGPDVPASAIWMREGQRALVLQIKRLARTDIKGEIADD
ncbi:hypothetical protein [Thalassospira sp. MCCC 1A02491]|uniref:Bbp19 family protein n=1 Tax=Thalassospira sp. MCCC 1A02491 TaxID=1769751 RepID=UPI0007AD7599|nr:hypothetical protein [Thalassospira sp. MCCC 1A02491]KZB65947.1 hypothetical protein AUQ42_13540 [Thalassospira sp. MCCC 1A02491]